MDTVRDYVDLDAFSPEERARLEEDQAAKARVLAREAQRKLKRSVAKNHNRAANRVARESRRRNK